jgi:hypothetical protein
MQAAFCTPGSSFPDWLDTSDYFAHYIQSLLYGADCVDDLPIVVVAALVGRLSDQMVEELTLGAESEDGVAHLL